MKIAIIKLSGLQNNPDDLKAAREVSQRLPKAVSKVKGVGVKEADVIVDMGTNLYLDNVLLPIVATVYIRERTKHDEDVYSDLSETIGQVLKTHFVNHRIIVMLTLVELGTVFDTAKGGRLGVSRAQ
jgi:hypothetical protein